MAITTETVTAGTMDATASGITGIRTGLLDRAGQATGPAVVEAGAAVVEAGAAAVAAGAAVAAAVAAEFFVQTERVMLTPQHGAAWPSALPVQRRSMPHGRYARFAVDPLVWPTSRRG